MKKIFLLMLALVISVSALIANSGQNQSNVATTNAASPKVLAVVGAYTAAGITFVYNSVTTASNAPIYLEDAANTYTATAATVTITASTIAQPGNGYVPLGAVMSSLNGSGYAYISGIKFKNGVVVDGNGLTITAVVVGK
jgi:hypothetical protein